MGLFAAARTPVRSGWQAGVAAGLVVPFAEPTLAVETVGWLGPTWRGRWADLGVDVVVPAAVAPAIGVARIGARLDPRLGVHFGALSVSVSGGMGVLESTDAGWSTDLRASLGIGYGR